MKRNSNDNQNAIRIKASDEVAGCHERAQAIQATRRTDNHHLILPPCKKKTKNTLYNYSIHKHENRVALSHSSVITTRSHSMPLELTSGISCLISTMLELLHFKEELLVASGHKSKSLFVFTVTLSHSLSLTQPLFLFLCLFLHLSPSVGVSKQV